MRLPIAIIGAGPCGLPVCRALDAAGLDYECLEASDRVGGVWNIGDEPTGAYRSLHTNTSTRAMAYSDFPFDVPSPVHLSAAELQRYFEAYADKFDLRARIRFEHRVERVTPLPEGNWRLDFEGRGSREYSAVIAATGQYVRPREISPPIPGDFDGEELHVFDYLDPVTPVDCRGRNVVVVGLGSSAAELATELSDPDGPVGRAHRVLLAARSGRWVLNKVIDGRPIDSAVPHPAEPLPRLIRALPSSVGVFLMRRAMKFAIRRMALASGSAESLGLPSPEIEPWEDRPTMSLGFVPALRAGRIDVRPGIKAFEGKRVRFSDDTSADVDVVLYATGYQLDFPYLAREVLGCDAPDLSLYRHIVHPEHANLFFVGCLRVGCSMWPVAEQQGRWIAKRLAGGFEIPHADVRRRRAVPLSTSLPVMCNFYIDDLRRQAGGL